MEDLGDLIDSLGTGELTCPVCGARMIPAGGREATCYYCGKVERADYVCENGHYVCEECRLASGEEIALRVALSASERDPADLADRMMTHPAVEIFGPVHHAIAAAAVLGAARAAGYPVEASQIQRAIRRVKVIPYGACGLLGTCGAAVGAGTALSALTGATYRSDRERTLALSATSKALALIAKLGGPRCCVASVYASLEAAVEVIGEELGLELELRDLRGTCPFSGRNPECHGPRCPYHPQTQKRVG